MALKSKINIFEANLTETILPYDGFKFSFEKGVKIADHVDWFHRNRHMSWFITAGYLITIFCLQEWMKYRKPYDLKKALALWNFGLSAFSMVTAWRVCTDLFSILNNYGFHRAVCTNLRHEFVDIWGILTSLSKVAELGDTLFIVLRKKQLIFLHWYHHAIVVIYGFYSFHDENSVSNWFIAINTCVHSIMYAYFGLRALNVYIPKKLSMLITGIQIAQMIMGIFLLSYTYSSKLSGYACNTSYGVLNFSIAIYFSFFLLFSKFFYDAYIKKSSKKRKDT